jgi:hypothetical protein
MAEADPTCSRAWRTLGIVPALASASRVRQSAQRLVVEGGSYAEAARINQGLVAQQQAHNDQIEALAQRSGVSTLTAAAMHSTVARSISRM